MWHQDEQEPVKLPEHLEDVTAQYALKMRRLYAIMSEMYAGGPGIEHIDEAFILAVKARNEVYKKLAETPNDPKGAVYEAEQSVKAELVKALTLPPDPVSDTGESFAENEIRITKQASKVIAHRMKDLIGKARAIEQLRDTVISVGEYEARQTRKRT